MRPRRRLVALSLAVSSAAVLPVVSHAGDNPMCLADSATIVTIGYDRPDWFCRFYAPGPLQFKAAGISGWTIRRIIRQRNDGTIEFVELAGKKPTDGGPIPTDAQFGTLATKAGDYIEVVVFSSMMYPPTGPNQYRDGMLDVRPA